MKDWWVFGRNFETATAASTSNSLDLRGDEYRVK